MSAETLQWLNENILVGFTSKRGKAWHWRENLQGDEPNNYEDAIPMADVTRRLFNWQPIELPMFVSDGNGGFKQIPDRKAIGRDDTRDILGVFKSGYTPHAYDEWLLDVPAHLIGEYLGIASAGLLKNGAQAFVGLEVPETISTKAGVDFRSSLTCADSLDGTLSSTYKWTATLPVCDNTLSAGLSEDGAQYKIKHSKYSALRIDDAREALNLMDQASEDFANDIEALTSWDVSTADFNKLLDELVPMPSEINKRGTTVATNKRDMLDTLYNRDERSATWNGTAFGILQAFNTYNQHYAGIRGETTRAMRNAENVLSGKFETEDRKVIDTLRLLTNKAA